jgi:hypothetical protein
MARGGEINARDERHKERKRKKENKERRVDQEAFFLEKRPG